MLIVAYRHLAHIKAQMDAIQARYPMSWETLAYEVKYAPRAKTKVNVDALNLLIPVIEPLIPPEMAERLKACVEKKADAFRIFSIKQKKYN